MKTATVACMYHAICIHDYSVVYVVWLAMLGWSVSSASRRKWGWPWCCWL